MLLHTDGLIESREQDLDAGLAGLADLLGRTADLDLEQLCDRIVTELLPDAGADDDVALIAVRA